MGSLQACVGQQVGIKAAIHSKNEMREQERLEFAHIIDPHFAKYIVSLSFYFNICEKLLLCTVKSVYFRMTEISSIEEATQDDLVSMTIYDIEVTTLMNKLIDILVDECKVTVKVLTYIDKFLSANKFKNLELNKIGPKFGY